MSGIELGIDHLIDVEEIGRGGFSTVYAATDTRFDRRVAVKVLGRLTDESDRRRFDAECRVMGRLSSHPSVVTVHSAGYTTDGKPYLLMELIEGGTLAQRLAGGGPMPWTRALDISRHIADAVGQAHEAGIMHRDIKPDNILMAGDEPRLTDFGIAYLRDATGATSKDITASWHHTAPETFSSNRDERADLYSLASTAYTLIAGHPPLWREGEDSLNPLMYRLLHEVPPSLPAHLAPADVDGFLQRGLAKDPAQRHQTASAFVAEIDAIRTSHAAAGTLLAIPHPTPGTGQPDALLASHAAAVWDAPNDPTVPLAATGGTGPASPDAGSIPPTGPVLGGSSVPPGGWTGPGAAGSGGPVPPGGWTGPGAAGSGPRRNWWLVALPVAVAFVVVASVAGAVVVLDDEEPAGASELVLEPVTSVGQDPFTDSVVPGPDGPGQVVEGASQIIEALNPAVGERSGTDFSGVKLPDQSGDGTISVAGSAPGLYGGTNLVEVCDRDALVEFLTSDEEKGAAWASVLGIMPDDIPDYVAGLTDVILQVDTRVTNHGYRDGAPVAIDSVLQAGTAVLVDDHGVPRVRCYCGNPLLEPRPLATAEPALAGTAWEGFDLAQAVIVSPVDAVSEFYLDDMISDGFLARVPGSPATEAELISEDDMPEQPTTSRSSSSTSAQESTETTPTTTRRTTTASGGTTTSRGGTTTESSGSSSTSSSSSSSSSSETTRSTRPTSSETSESTEDPNPNDTTSSTKTTEDPNPNDTTSSTEGPFGPPPSPSLTLGPTPTFTYPTIKRF